MKQVANKAGSSTDERLIHPLLVDSFLAHIALTDHKSAFVSN
jgi:hypothetical protein